MTKFEKREVTKKVLSVVAQMGIGALGGAISGVILKNINANIFIKIAIGVGLFGLTNKTAKDAEKGISDYTQELFTSYDQLVDSIKNINKSKQESVGA